jgi:hypothetical protein
MILCGAPRWTGLFDVTSTSNVSWSRKALLMLLILLIASAGLTTYLIAHYIQDRTALRETAFNSAETQAAAATEQINQAFDRVMTIARRLADDLSNGWQPYTTIRARLEEETLKNPDIDGLAVTFQPYLYDPEVRLYQTYTFQDKGGGFAWLDGASYDYSQPPSDEPGAPQTAWYHGPLENGAMWNEPFFATGAQKVLIEYGVPFYQINAEGERVPAGVVTIDYSLADVRDLVSGLQLGETGYGFVTAQDGTFLANPVQRLVAQSSIFEIAQQTDNLQLEQAARQALNGETTFYESADSVTGEASWVFLNPIKTTGWVFGIVLNQVEYAPDARATIQAQMSIVVAASACVFFIAALVFRVYRGGSASLWATAVTFSLFCIALIITAWVLSSSLPPGGGVRVVDQAAVDRYVESYSNSLETTSRPILIPTGILVQAIQFPDPTTVNVNGYIWGRYPRALAAGVERGYMFPDQVDNQGFVMDEVSRQVQGDTEIITWYFGVLLHQSFDTTQFPFDSRDITVRLMPRELQANVLLIPDLNSYTFTNPRLRPGLDPEVSINNWEIKSSAFHYKIVDYNTDFGIPNRALRGVAPELRFTINSQRYFLGAFIAYLLPGLVAAGMMFAYQLQERQPGNDEEIEKTLTYSAALFFVIAIVHTALRDNIAAVGLTYIEYLYVLLYFITLVVIGDSLIITFRPNWKIVHYRNNLIIKLLYWPLILGVLLVATLAIFVYNG